MGACGYVLLLLVPTVAALGLLAFAFATDWWLRSDMTKMPTELNPASSNSVKSVEQQRKFVKFYGMFSECVEYKTVRIVIYNNMTLPKYGYEAYSIVDSGGGGGGATTAHVELARNCNDAEFICPTGVNGMPGKYCIAKSKVCDQTANCAGGEDETREKCIDQARKCPTGKQPCSTTFACIASNQKCNGENDCGDYSDEVDCHESCASSKPNIQTVVCLDRSCRIGERCNGKKECTDGSDEQCSVVECQKNAVKHCDDRCYPREAYCDGHPQCVDLADEKNCPENTTSFRFDTAKACFARQLLFYFPSAMEHNEKKLDFQEFHYIMHLIILGLFGGSMLCMLIGLVALLTASCCKYRTLCPFIVTGVSYLLGALSAGGGLGIFFYLWLDRRMKATDASIHGQDALINQLNSWLKEIEFFGLSFFLCCGAVGSAFVAVIITCFTCCRMPHHSRREKEYETIRMDTM